MDIHTHDLKSNPLEESLTNNRASSHTGSTEQYFSIDDIISKIGFGVYQFKAYFFLGMISMNDGAETVLLSILQNVLAKDWALSSKNSDIIGSAVFAGFFLGALISGKISDKYGRRRPQLYLGPLAFIFGISSAFSNSFVALAILRALYAFIVGAQIPMSFSHLTEITPRVIRGRCLVLGGIFFTLGELLPCLMSYFTLDGISSGNWRLLIIYTTIPALIGWLGIVFTVYESPRYLIATQKDLKQGMEVMMKMAQQNKVELALGPEEEHNLDIWVWHHANLRNSQVASWSSLFKGRAKLITLYLWPVWFILSLSYYGMVYILPRVVVELDVDKINVGESDLWSITYPILGEIPAIILAVLLIEQDRFGRRRSMTGGTLLAAFLCVLAAWAPFFMVWVIGARTILNAVFLIGTPYTSELYPTTVRTTGLGLANSFSRFAGALMPWVSQSMLDVGPKVPFLGFASFCLLGSYCCHMIAYDTTKRELDFEYTVTKEGKSPTHEPSRKRSESV